MFANTAYIQTNGNDLRGQVGNPSRPFQTIAAALLAMAGLPAIWLKIGFGRFAVPPYNAWPQSFVTIVGSGKGIFNNQVTQLNNNLINVPAATRLVGGTVLAGPLGWLDASNIKIYNLGVDVGMDYLSAGGTATNAIFFGRAGSDENGTTNVTPYNLGSGIEIKNVSMLLGSSSAAFHNLVMEGCYAPALENIDTMYGVHGIAYKSTRGSIKDVHSYYHDNNGIIIKSNNYSNANGVVLDGFWTTNCGAGVRIHNRNIIEMRDITVSHGHIQGGTYGVVTEDSYSHGFKGLLLNSVKVRGAATASFSLTGHSASAARNCWNNDTLYEFQN